MSISITFPRLVGGGNYNLILVNVQWLITNRNYDTYTVQRLLVTWVTKMLIVFKSLIVPLYLFGICFFLHLHHIDAIAFSWATLSFEDSSSGFSHCSAHSRGFAQFWGIVVPYSFALSLVCCCLSQSTGFRFPWYQTIFRLCLAFVRFPGQMLALGFSPFLSSSYAFALALPPRSCWLTLLLWLVFCFCS